MINKEVLKELEESWGYKIVSESPLVITNEEGEHLVGDIAMALVDRVKEDMGDEEMDLSKLKEIKDDQQLLVTASVNYADEFDMNEFMVMSAIDFKSIVKTLRKHKDSIEWGFGTNEEMYYNNGKDLLNCLSFKAISDEEAEVVNSLFGGAFDGGGHVFDTISSLGEDEEAEEDENDEFSDYGLETIERTQIEKLRIKGFIVEPHNADTFQLRITDPEGIVSTVHGSMIEDLTKYLRKKR